MFQASTHRNKDISKWNKSFIEFRAACPQNSLEKLCAHEKDLCNLGLCIHKIIQLFCKVNLNNYWPYSVNGRFFHDFRHMHFSFGSFQYVSQYYSLASIKSRVTVIRIKLGNWHFKITFLLFVCENFKHNFFLRLQKNPGRYKMSTNIVRTDCVSAIQSTKNKNDSKEYLIEK